MEWFVFTHIEAFKPTLKLVHNQGYVTLKSGIFIVVHANFLNRNKIQVLFLWLCSNIILRNVYLYNALLCQKCFSC